MNAPTRAPGDWDDARLAAAFAARAEEAPRSTAGLVASTIEQLRAERSVGRRIGWPAAVASGTAAVVVVALGLVVVGSGPLVGRTPSPSAPGSGSAVASQSASASADGSPASTASPGPDVAVSVSQALAFRDASRQDGEIRITGWLRDTMAAVPCPAPAHPLNPARVDCPLARPWIVEARSDAGPAAGVEGPAGPGIQPSFALVDDRSVPNPTEATPIEISVTGHFYDRRAVLCPSFDCEYTFVVDRIDSVGGAAIGATTSAALSVPVERGDTISSVQLAPPTPADQLDAALGEVTGISSPLLVINRRVMSTDALLDAEPGLAGGWSGIGTARIVTALTAIETGEGSGSPRPQTFLFPDRSPVFYSMTADGPVVAGNLVVQSFPDLASRVGAPITVSAAIDRRDHALDPTELLVAGWSWAPGPISCTPLRPSQPVLDQCPSGSTWLAEDRPVTQAGNALPQHSGPAINLVIPPESANLAPLSSTPALVAVLGHFDDHRAGTCPSGLTERCRRNFIVDAILDPAQLALEPALAAIVHPAPSNTPKGTASWAADAAGLPESGRPDRLISVFPIAVAALGTLEPQLAGTQSLVGIDTVWLLHFLDQDAAGNPIVRTRLVIDAAPGSGAVQVFDVTGDGMSAGLAAAP
jgi:hypothetical protein